MKPDDKSISKRQTRSSTKQKAQSRKRKGQETSDTESAKEKSRKKKENEAAEDEKKMGNFMSKWLFGSKKETEQEIEWRRRVQERAEDEAKWEREEKRRILRAKALRAPPSDTEDDEVDRATLTLMEQRERDEERASRQREHYDIRKQRLAFHHEGRLVLSAFEVDKLAFLIQCRENESNEWDYTLLPEFRLHYDRLVLKHQHDGEAQIAARQQRYQEERRRREEFKQQALLVDVAAADAQADVTSAATNDVTNTAASSAAIDDATDTANNSLTNRDSIKAGTSGSNVNVNTASNKASSSATNSVINEGASESADGGPLSPADVHAENHSDDSCSQDSERMRALSNDYQYTSAANGYSNSISMEDETAPSTSGLTSEDYAHSMSPSPRSDATDDTIDVTMEQSQSYDEEAATLVTKKKKKLSKQEKRELEHQRQRVERKRKLKLVSRWSMEDTKEYRKGYPGKLEIPDIVENKEFYFNQCKSQPDGGTIEEILENWKGDYNRLERHHGYIQWLFPIREKGMNYQSYELQPHEIKEIMADETAKGRVVRAYKLMLDFYGMELVDETTGEVARSEREDHWRNRARHLNKSFHNYLRITRILKCLGELGYEHYKAPFIKFMLVESLERETLANCARSCMEYWLYTLRDDKEREALITMANKMIDRTTASALAHL